MCHALQRMSTPPLRLRPVAHTIAAVLGLESQLSASLLESGQRKPLHRKEAARRSVSVTSPYSDILNSIAALRWTPAQ